MISLSDRGANFSLFRCFPQCNSNSLPRLAAGIRQLTLLFSSYMFQNKNTLLVAERIALASSLRRSNEPGLVRHDLVTKIQL